MTDEPEVEIRRLRADDAAQLAACFERCYGSTYTSPEFYDPARIAQRVTEGSLRSAVAEAGDGRIVAHVGMTVRHANARSVEAGNTVVDPAFRGRRLTGRIGALLHEMCADDGFIGYHHYPTTAHPVMQKLAAEYGVEMGVMLAHIPAETDYQQMDVKVAGRVAAIIAYQPVGPAPHRDVYLPTRYRTLLDRLYQQAGFPRTVCPSSEEPRRGPADVTVAWSERRRLSTITVRATGDDLDAVVQRELSEHSLDVVHVDLLMNHPHLDHAIAVLQRRGFVYCGLLPEFVECDVLRMQLVTQPTSGTFEPQVATDGGKALLREILADGA